MAFDQVFAIGAAIKLRFHASWPRPLWLIALGDAVELAYRRSDALERRRALMEAWCDYLASG